MKRSERMKMLHSVAEHDERKECQALGEAQRKLKDELSRLEELNAYRQQYRQSMLPKSGQSALHWQEHHKFLNRLDQAVAMQDQVVRDGRSKREAHKKHWMLKRRRLDSLARVVERYRATETERADRQLQSIEDSQRIRQNPFGEER